MTTPTQFLIVAPGVRLFPNQFQPAEYMEGYLFNYSDAELGATVAFVSKRLRAKSGPLKYLSHTTRNIASSWHSAALKEMGRRVAASLVEA